MKKIVALLLAFVMVFALCACGAKEEAPASAPATESASAPAAVEEAAPATLKAGFIFLHDENSTYDLNFINAAKAACEELGVEYMFKTNIPESEAAYDAACELIDDGCNYIFGDSFGHEPYLLQAAREFPEVQFCHATGTQAHTAGVANYHNAFASSYEGRFLGGVAAGMKLNEMIENGEITADEAKAGYIAAYPYAEVKSGYTSFFLGVRYACPSATMDVTFTNSWYDPTLEQEGAIKLIENDCKVISLHADSMGAPTECQNNGVPFVFYNGSAIDVCPDTYITSTYINWKPYMVYSMQCVLNGEEIAADWTGSMAGGSVDMWEVNEAVAAAGTVEKMAEVREMLENGTLKVFDTATFTVNGETLTTYLADVDDLGDFVGETEAVADGYFHESEYRSAPYFDLDIDGITNLDA